MPKHDALSAKAISNRQKSVGLQKLRWYCQMCQKQCRDENGFKCHTTSESHLRQMRLFAENPHAMIDDFSREFETGFISTLSHRHGTKRVQANRVYQEYIADKHHIHMNATMWTSLTELCKYLGREGKAVVDETEKGWFIQYIDRDPRLLAKQAAADQRKVVELDEEERTRRAIEAQIAAAARAADGDGDGTAGNNDGELDAADLELKRDDAAGKIEVAFAAKKRPLKAVVPSASVFGGDAARGPSGDEPPTKKLGALTSSSSSSSSSTTSMRAIDQLMMEEENRKRRQQLAQTQAYEASAAAADDAIPNVRHDHWLATGIVVRCMNKKLADGKFYKQKGTVVAVHDTYVAEVRIDEGGSRIRIDQDQLETVIPKVGRPCLVLNGRGRGMRGTLLRIHEDKYNCDVVLDSGNRELTGVEYEDVCKLADE